MYETIGKEIHCGLKHPIYYSEVPCINEMPTDECFHLLLIEQGSGIICFQDCTISFIAPTLLCINEKDLPIFKNCSNVKIKSIYFHPYLINPLFNYKNIRDTEKVFSYTQQEDRYLLLPFIHRDNNYKGLLSMGPDTFSRKSKLFEFIARELHLQRDVYWPCRSRSYFLELLILVTKLFDSNHDLLENNLPSLPESIDNIVTYLHNNYQDKITLEQLSNMFNTNRTSLNNQFYKATNLSVIDYLIKLRVNLASTMLRDTMLPIFEIMGRVGFNDSSNFWRIFKKHTTLSPKEYRKKYCWIKE